MKFEIISAPKNPYKKPKGVKNKTFNLGDIVQTPDGDVGAIIDIQEGYRDRADEWHNKPVYRLNLDYLPGSPRIEFMGWELSKVDVMELIKANGKLKAFVDKVSFWEERDGYFIDEYKVELLKLGDEARALLAELADSESVEGGGL